MFLGVLNYALELFLGEGEEEVACKRLSLVSAVPGGLVSANTRRRSPAIETYC